MEGDRAKRRLAAIVAADIAGYSRLVGADEEGTLARLKALRREVVDPRLAEHAGRIVKTTGDGLLMEFASAVDAVRCVVEIQRAMAAREEGLPENRRLRFRIGVNVGDIVVDGDDILGDGVNVAARLEQLAEPGGICVSARAHEDVRGRLDLDVQDIGEQTLKNIERPIRVFRIAVQAPGATPLQPALSLPDKPSIAVLPFQNMSGDPEQDYFCDGLVEEVITALSRFHWLFVIARNSSFTYKGKAVDVKRVSRELGVRYVLEGSVRKSGQKVRITGQLIDGTTGVHIWADRFDGDLSDIFDLQDRVAVNVVAAIEPKIQSAEIERAKRAPTASLDAYDLYLRALPGYWVCTKEGMTEALALLYRAIAVSSDYALAYARAAEIHIWLRVQGWSSAPLDTDRDKSIELAKTAVRKDRDNPEAAALAGWTMVYWATEVGFALDLLAHSLAQNPNYAHAWLYSGAAHAYLGRADISIEHISRAERLSPRDPLKYWMLAFKSAAYMLVGRYEEAVEIGLQSRSIGPHNASTYRILAACYAHLGRHSEAREAVQSLLRLQPGFRVGNVAHLKIAFFQGPQGATYLEGLRKAGFPE